MSGIGPFGPGNPFEGMPFFADLARMLSQQGPVAWDAARQMAMSIATGGTTEDNIDPVERIRLEQLARVADLHVGSTLGLTTSGSGSGISVVPVTRGQWVQRSVDAYRPLFEGLASSLAPGAAPAAPTPDPDDDPDAAMGAWLGGMMAALGPMMLGVTAGSMLGHLAERSLGQYDLPVPRPASDELMVVLRNVDELGEAWSLDADELRLWVCLHEIAHHTVLRVPHVRARLDGLLRDYVSSFRPDTGGLEDRLGGFDPTNPSGLADLQSMLGDPEVILGAIRSPEQEALLPRLEAVVAVIAGVVDWTMDRAGERIMSSYGRITEASRRRRVDAAAEDRFVGKLLGLELTQEQYDRGAAFVEGVVERAGTDGIDLLWRSDAHLPTPAEVDAPGLWLARLELHEPPTDDTP
ncbi:MAG TPA: zinc-dependent metalloprotease [Acidimicrobiales bacterium]|nr:zinc-dependent metalloprotease [Acidimicrobiales bacterium]